MFWTSCHLGRWIRYFHLLFHITSCCDNWFCLLITFFLCLMSHFCDQIHDYHQFHFEYNQILLLKYCHMHNPELAQYHHLHHHFAPYCAFATREIKKKYFHHHHLTIKEFGPNDPFWPQSSRNSLKGVLYFFFLLVCVSKLDVEICFAMCKNCHQTILILYWCPDYGMYRDLYACDIWWIFYMLFKINSSVSNPVMPFVVAATWTF